jgi:protein-L-isoaspartate O-methyltransferase
MTSGVPLEELRRRYADEITASAGIAHTRVEEAFATIPREDFLAPPPWTIFAPGGLFMTETADPAELYQDVLVVLDRERGINNGQPSLHAAWLAALDPQPGEVALHIGAGTGYYTAILAALVAPGGAVHAYEIEPHLAGLARQNLAALETVTVYPVSGVGAALPASDVSILVGSCVAPAIAAMMIERRMKAAPSTAVERVRKSAAPRAVMNPDELPPTPSPPPSERCIRITPTSEAATSVWTISRKANMAGFLLRRVARSRRWRPRLQPRPRRWARNRPP